MGRKARNTRRRSQKTLNNWRIKARKYKSSEWKLDFPEIFKEISYFPFIVRRDDKRFK